MCVLCFYNSYTLPRIEIKNALLELYSSSLLGPVTSSLPSSVVGKSDDELNSKSIEMSAKTNDK